MISLPLPRWRRSARRVAVLAVVVVLLTACTDGPADRLGGEFGPPTATPPEPEPGTGEAGNATGPLAQQDDTANGQSGSVTPQQDSDEGGGQTQVMATATTSARFGAVFSCQDPTTQCRGLLAEQQAGPLRLQLLGSEISPDTLVVVVSNEGTPNTAAVSVSVLVQLISVDALDGGGASPASELDAPQSADVTVADVVGGVTTDRGTCASNAIDSRTAQLGCELGDLEPGASGTVTVDYLFVPQTTVANQVELVATVEPT